LGVAMLKAQDVRIARRLKRRLQQNMEVLSLVVFGSRARGDDMSESDMDIFVKIPALTPEVRQRIREVAWEVGLESGMVISTFVTTPEEIQNGPMGANPLLIAVEREGIPV